MSDYCLLTNFDDEGYYFYIAATTDDYERNNLYNSEGTGIDFMGKINFEEIVIPETTYFVLETEKSLFLNILNFANKLPQSGYLTTSIRWLMLPNLQFIIGESQADIQKEQ